MELLDWIRSSVKNQSVAVDRRSFRRSRTRLRPGKILDEDRRFLADCSILDRSGDGARIRIFGGLNRVPDAVLVFDENRGTAVRARLAWHRPPEAGFRLDERAESLSEEDIRRLTGPYYAVTD